MTEYHDDDPPVRYFGPPRARKEWEVQVDTPVGAVCELCSEAVQEGDVGTINWVNQVMHYECIMRSAIGSVGHQKRQCSCFGGTEEDPPGMTLREAAIAAVDYWNAHGQQVVVAPAPK